MKQFKMIDLGISITLILVFGVLGYSDIELLLVGYFVVGGWQVLSMVVHTAFGWFTHPGSKRSVYHWITVITILLMPCVFIFYVLLYAAPVMAIYYCRICYLEIRSIQFRELIHLK